MEKETQKPRTFWDFCHEHPVVIVMIVLFMSWGAINVASAITGHWSDDEFWKQNGSCK